MLSALVKDPGGGKSFCRTRSKNGLCLDLPRKKSPALLVTGGLWFGHSIFHSLSLRGHVHMYTYPELLCQLGSKETEHREPATCRAPDIWKSEF